MLKLKALLVLGVLLTAACCTDSQVAPKPTDLAAQTLQLGGPGKVMCEVTVMCVTSPVPMAGTILADAPEPEVKPKAKVMVTGDVSSMAEAIKSQMAVAYRECPVGIVVTQCRM